MRVLFCFLLLLAPAGAFGQTGGLQLAISTSRAVTEPLAAEITLHFHNAGQQTLWLYRPVRDPSAMEWEARFGALPSSYGPEATSGSSEAAVHLVPVSSAATQAMTSPAHGVTFESAQFPHPKVLRLDAGGDLQEKILARLVPATEESGGTTKTLWGAYKLSVDYRARFSNGNELERILGVRMWQGQVTSNTIEVDLQAPPAANHGEIEGSVATADGRAIAGAIVSLSDREERTIGQTIAGSGGEFSFQHLPPGFYWVTARRRDATQDTAVFNHVELSPSQPSGRADMVMLAEEIYKADRLLHKPVFIRVTDSQDHPVSGIRLRDVYSTGTILEDVRAEVSDDGLAVMELIPGRNFMTLQRRGCKKEERRVDVAPGSGVDGSKLVLECGK